MASTWDLLDSFSVDDLPMFSRTVLTSSPVLVLPDRKNVSQPLKGEARASFRNSFESGNFGDVFGSANPEPAASLVRQPAESTDAEELPEILQELVRLQKRNIFQLFRDWEEAGNASVPLRVFAQGIQSVTGTRLSDDDLLTVLQCADPVRGDEMLVGERWRSRKVDCTRLYRKMQNYAARASSRYIRANSVHGAVMLDKSSPTLKKRESFQSMVERQSASQM
jgi:hypothetical protein